MLNNNGQFFMKKSFKTGDALTTFDPSEQLQWAEIQIELLHDKIQDLQWLAQDLLDKLENADKS
jgi:hypothetical protein